MDIDKNKLIEALEKIASWMPKDYEKDDEYWSWGNYDDAYSYGCDTAYHECAQVAKKALESCD